MLYSGTDRESYITEYTFVYEDPQFKRRGAYTPCSPVGDTQRGPHLVDHSDSRESSWNL